ncbi:cation-translocating P-type ATPase [Propionicicella superfundia]|uniref:cation-translocating P-type ATPase n=1 Tax=Propionicicella superfundia TaxID=348582 RepID=UPI0006853C10|nr:cation-transporting P-type ATPase [Propionicicella superfundia]
MAITHVGARRSVPEVAADLADRAYHEPAGDLCAALGTDPVTGLADDRLEASRERYGPNTIVELHRESMLVKYLRQYADAMIILLIGCALVTGYLGDLTTAVVLVVLVLVNTGIGFVQEFHAEKTMEALDELVEPLTQAYRDGRLTDLDSRTLVVGDLVRLTEGASVPADVRLVRVQGFATNDFALTGESEPTRKQDAAIGHDVPLANRYNMAYAGTTVATGEALGVVVAVGAATELGRIAALSQTAPPTPGPLQHEMSTLARYVTIAVIALSAILLVVAVSADMPLRHALLFAVGFASALVPQGLPAEVNTALASAAAVLARHKALVKKLSAVETLGATHVICTDKTGTLTKNEMTVTELVCQGRAYALTGTGYRPEGRLTRDGAAVQDPDEAARVGRMLTTAALASNARLLPADHQHRDWHVLGDPTEGCLLAAAGKVGIAWDTLDDRAPEVTELPFDSVRKRMTSVRRRSDGTLVACVKGAPESVLSRCTRIRVDDTDRELTEDDRRTFLAGHTDAARRALRTLAVAERPLAAGESGGGIERIENDLTLLGMVAMMDPLRDEVPTAVREAVGAQLRLNIVTGDSPITARAIAEQAGLPDLRVVRGDELAAMPDEEVARRAIAGGTVFARVTPEDKMRIVDLIERRGLVVAVTGDGINDAPALKHASIGVAMGVTGTDVAKQASSVVLLDDSFATLIEAVRQGRTIFANIGKGVLSCLTSNLAEFFVNTASLVLALVAGVPLALGVLQILAIDLLGEIFPIAAVGRDPEEGRTMHQPPRSPHDHIVNPRSILDVAWTGLVIGALAIGNYLAFYPRHGVNPFTADLTAAAVAPLVLQATTMTYATVLLCQLVNIVQRRSAAGLWSRYQLSNPLFWGAVGLALAILGVIVYVPWVAGVFATGPLGPADWAWIGAAVVCFALIRESARVAGSRRRPREPVGAPNPAASQ